MSLDMMDNEIDDDGTLEDHDKDVARADFDTLRASVQQQWTVCNAIQIQLRSNLLRLSYVAIFTGFFMGIERLIAALYPNEFYINGVRKPMEIGYYIMPIILLSTGLLLYRDHLLRKLHAIEFRALSLFVALLRSTGQYMVATGRISPLLWEIAKIDLSRMHIPEAEIPANNPYRKP